MKPAPIFTDAFDLGTWLAQRLGPDAHPIALATFEDARRLLLAITLALKGRRRDDNIDEADERLIMLRVGLRLMAAAGLLEEAGLLHALEYADRIGRQLGGWQRSLGGAS